MDKTNWKKGREGNFRSPDFHFVTPSVNGFVSIEDPPYSVYWEHIEKETFKSLKVLSRKFGKVGFFESHRVAGFGGYALFEKGEVIRVYATIDDAVLADIGEMTHYESEYFETDYEEAKKEAKQHGWLEEFPVKQDYKALFSDEFEVGEICKKFSGISPMEMDTDYPNKTELGILVNTMKDSTVGESQ